MTRENYKEELHKTMIKKHGSLKAWREYMRGIGSVGGKKGGGIGGFKDKDLARRAGRLGGFAKYNNRKNSEQ